VASWLNSRNLVDQAQRIRIVLKGINNMLGKYKKLICWTISLLNVLSADGMKHLRGHEDKIPIMDCFL